MTSIWFSTKVTTAVVQQQGINASKRTPCSLLHTIEILCHLSLAGALALVFCIVWSSFLFFFCSSPFLLSSQVLNMQIAARGCVHTIPAFALRLLLVWCVVPLYLLTLTLAFRLDRDFQAIGIMSESPAVFPLPHEDPVQASTCRRLLTGASQCALRPDSPSLSLPLSVLPIRPVSLSRRKPCFAKH